jgi:hypothetical protein
MVLREHFLKQLVEYGGIFPICGIVGPRQCGKTTLALEYAKHFTHYHHFDCEDPQDAYLLQHPKLAFKGLKGLIIIDEIQRIPDLFPYLRVYADLNPECKILVLGSFSPDLLRQISESLAGRIGYIELTPFYKDEVGFSTKLWQRGGFPKSYLAPSDRGAHLWLRHYISTFLEKDIAAMGFKMYPEEMRKLWVMAAHYHGNLVNYSEIGRSLNLSDMTIRKYLGILEHAFMVRLLKPWHENISKRQIKNPKIFVRDSGILHTLLGISFDDLFFHPKIGASWEGFALEETIRHHQFEKEECYFWRTQDGAELDLLIYRNGKKIGFEFKYGDFVKITPSMRIALADLNLDSLTVITPGDRIYSLDEKITVQGLKHGISL